MECIWPLVHTLWFSRDWRYTAIQCILEYRSKTKIRNNNNNNLKRLNSIFDFEYIRTRLRRTHLTFALHIVRIRMQMEYHFELISKRCLTLRMAISHEIPMLSTNYGEIFKESLVAIFRTPNASNRLMEFIFPLEIFEWYNYCQFTDRFIFFQMPVYITSDNDDTRSPFKFDA